MDSIKGTIKKLLDRKAGFDTLNASQLPAEAEYVSFDIFDTLILRRTGEPKSVFSLFERKLQMPGFSERRIAAEMSARKKKPSGEVTLREIYSCFGGLSEAEADRYCELELKAELSVCVPNKRLIGFYRDCLKSKKVILISDMYLTSDMMKQLLDKCGITGYQKLYISCEAGVSKRSGELYRYVLDDLDISPAKLVHIGNDIMTDHLCAKKAGLKAIKLKTLWNKCPYKTDVVLEINVDDLGFGGVYSLVRNVIKNNQSNLEIDIAAIEPFVHKSNVSELRSCGTKVFYVGDKSSKLKKQPATYFKLKRLISDRGYSCVHIHSDVANKQLICGLAAKKAGAEKIIMHSHSSGIDNDKAFLRTAVHKLCRRLLKYIGTDFAACSDRAAEWMFPNVSLEKVVMINNGVDIGRFSFNAQIRKRVRNELGLGSELLIGHVGRFSFQKNHEYLIRIMKAVHEKNCDAKLILVGIGEGETAAREQVHLLGLDKNVIFYGTSDKVNELLQAMDIFVLPSRFEGLPIVGVEAQAAGLPVIFSDRITRSAALTDKVLFCPIKKSSLEKWASLICVIGSTEYDRRKDYESLKSKGFSINDTVNVFLKLYQS